MKRNSDKPIKITEVSLRDGSHAVKHQFTEAQVKSVNESAGRCRDALYRG